MGKQRQMRFAAHVLAAVVRMNDGGWTLSKQRSVPAYIDAVIALAQGWTAPDIRPAEGHGWQLCGPTL